MDAAGRIEMGFWVASKAMWTQRGASKWASGWQGKQFGRSGAHRSGMTGDKGGNCDAAGRIEVDFWVSQKCLKTKNHEGQRQGAQEVHKRESDLDLPGRIQMDLRVSTKRESRGTAEGAQPSAQRVAQPPPPPVVIQLSDSF